MSGLLTPGSNDPEVRLRAEIASLKRRVEAIERDNFAAPVVAGTPTNGGEGAIAGDTAGTKLWMKVNGVWRFVTLT